MSSDSDSGNSLDDSGGGSVSAAASSKKASGTLRAKDRKKTVVQYSRNLHTASSQLVVQVLEQVLDKQRDLNAAELRATCEALQALLQSPPEEILQADAYVFDSALCYHVSVLTRNECVQR